MVLKPSEIAPFSAQIWAEVLHEAGVPPGVFNLVNGHGPTVGAAISAHPDIDMVSFTGSTRAGIEVARRAAPTVKRVSQELGGKSPNIILEDADLQAAIRAGVKEVMLNTGQTCSALTRILAPRTRMAEVIKIARQTAESVSVGPPESDAEMGPLASRAQWEKVQRLIQRGVDDGAVLVTGGLGRPEGLDVGYYVKPTVFADVTPAMAIAQEEVFGPVVAILGYDTVDQAVEMANDTPYGLSSGVSGRDPAQVRAVTRRLRAGQVYVNGADLDIHAPFGGYKQSGNGREWGPHGFADYLEVKAVMGHAGLNLRSRLAVKSSRRGGAIGAEVKDHCCRGCRPSDVERRRRLPHRAPHTEARIGRARRRGRRTGRLRGRLPDAPFPFRGRTRRRPRAGSRR